MTRERPGTLAKDPKHKAKLQELQQALLKRFKETHPLAKELPAGASVEEALGLVLRTARCESEFGRLQILKDSPKLTLSSHVGSVSLVPPFAILDDLFHSDQFLDSRHSRESGNPGVHPASWIPAPASYPRESHS